MKIAKHGCYIELVETFLKGVTEILEAVKSVANAQDQINAINTVGWVHKKKKLICKKLSEYTLFTYFNTALEDETTMNSVKNTVENKRPLNEFINEWKGQHNATVRNKNKEKQQEMMEKRWSEYFLPPSKPHKDPDTSLVFSCDSNATEASTNPKQQITSYKPNISEIMTIQRPPGMEQTYPKRY